MSNERQRTSETHVKLAHERLAKASSEGSFTTGLIESWDWSAANCAAAGMERANTAEARVRLLENILQASPCTCMTYGTCSFPPQPTDHLDRHWCGRCRALGYDKNPEPKHAFFFPNQAGGQMNEQHSAGTSNHQLLRALREIAKCLELAAAGQSIQLAAARGKVADVIDWQSGERPGCGCSECRSQRAAPETPAVPFGASSHRFAIECEGCKRGVTITLGQGVVLGYQCSCGHYTKLRDAEKASEHLDPLCNCPVDSWGIVRCQEDSGIVRCRAEVNAENGPEQR